MPFVTGPASGAAGAPGEVHTTQLNPIGMEAVFSDHNSYVYLPGVASTVAGSWVTISAPTGHAAAATALLTGTARGPVAIATAATVANTWGWYLVKGWYSGAHAGSNGTIVSGAGYLQAEVSSGGTGRVVLGASAAAESFIFGAYSYSAQPDTDSVAAGTPGIDQIVVYVRYPFAALNY
jgi:hypothetical protein